MNRFLIEDQPDAIAKSLCDQHIVKMPLEEAQMLCTAIWHHAPEYAEGMGVVQACASEASMYFVGNGD